MSEVWWDNGTYAGGLKPHFYAASSHPPGSLLHLPLSNYPAPTTLRSLWGPVHR